jgi:hypothetical protein
MALAQDATRFCNIPPEELALIAKGALQEDRTLGRGWVEQWDGSVRKLVAAPQFKDLVFGYRKDPARMVHRISIDPELVLDRPEIDRMRTRANMDAATYGGFHDEWIEYIRVLFKVTFEGGDPVK